MGSKMQKIGLFGSLKSLEIATFDGANMKLALYSNCVPILHHFSDTARHWLKIAYSHLPHLYLSAQLE